MDILHFPARVLVIQAAMAATGERLSSQASEGARQAPLAAEPSSALRPVDGSRAEPLDRFRVCRSRLVVVGTARLK
jgi:hypothetical protein